jgi:hypothetical protein
MLIASEDENMKISIKKTAYLEERGYQMNTDMLNRLIYTGNQILAIYSYFLTITY